jgi:hypothetical protein
VVLTRLRLGVAPRLHWWRAMHSKVQLAHAASRGRSPSGRHNAGAACNHHRPAAAGTPTRALRRHSSSPRGAPRPAASAPAQPPRQRRPRRPALPAAAGRGCLARWCPSGPALLTRCWQSPRPPGPAPLCPTAAAAASTHCWPHGCVCGAEGPAADVAGLFASRLLAHHLWRVEGLAAAVAGRSGPLATSRSGHHTPLSARREAGN